MEIIQHGLFDGKVCSRCGEWRCIADYHRHPSTKDKRDAKCKFCKRAYTKSISAKATERTRQWRADHKEIIRPRLAAQARQYRQTHGAQWRAYLRSYSGLHPEYSAVTSLRYIARKRGALGEFSVVEWRALCDYFGNRCLCCGEQKPLAADHVVPLSVGGDNTIGNIQPLCRECNSSKGAKIIDYRINYQRFE